MRWNNLLTSTTEPTQPGGALPLPLAMDEGPVVEVRTPEFRGVTFYELRARSIINKVPGESAMPFRWTINPYRGCTHACTYCFARNTHTYLGLDTGADFDTKIIVKVNAAQLLAKELAAPSWQGESIAMGTNVDPYQRAEGRYRLMRGLLTVLRDRENPFSILTKGTLVLRDLDLLTAAARRTTVRLSVSVGSLDERLWRSVESGTPSPKARLGVCRTLRQNGLRCGVLMAPVLPFLSDSREQLEETVAAIASSGATSITPLVLHLRPGAREWYFQWLHKNHPKLVPRYERLYSRGAYADRDYSADLARRVRVLAQRHGLGGGESRQTRENSEFSQNAENLVPVCNTDARVYRHTSHDQLALI